MENCLIKSRAELLYLLLHQSSNSLAQLLMQTSCASRFTPNTKDRELSQILLRTHNPVWQITILTWEQCRSNKHPALLSSSNIYMVWLQFIVSNSAGFPNLPGRCCAYTRETHCRVSQAANSRSLLNCWCGYMKPSSGLPRWKRWVDNAGAYCHLKIKAQTLAFENGTVK